jgi:hypothetical protein
MKKFLFPLAALLLSFSAEAQNVDKLMQSYLAVKDALVSSDSKAASAALGDLQKSIEGESSFAQKEALLKATEKMAKSTNIESQRAAFNGVSTTMWQVVKSADKRPQPVYYQYCPMKKAYWLSNEKEIRNPYYGASMLSCGKVAETIK